MDYVDVKCIISFVWETRGSRNKWFTFGINIGSC